MALGTDSWMPLLTARLPGAVQSHLVMELQTAIKDFCKESSAWRGVLRDIDITTGERTIDLSDGLTDRRVIGVLAVYRSVAGRQLSDRTHFPFADGTTTGWTATGDDPGVIELDTTPTADEASALSAWVYFEPLDAAAAESFPTVLTSTFWEAIFDGALGRMYGEPNKPYTNATSAQYHMRRYRGKTREAKAKAAAGFTPNGANWSFPRFGR